MTISEKISAIKNEKGEFRRIVIDALAMQMNLSNYTKFILVLLFSRYRIMKQDKGYVIIAEGKASREVRQLDFDALSEILTENNGHWTI